MTNGKPPTDAHILTMFWDGGGRYDVQIAFSVDNDINKLKGVSIRGKSNTDDYKAWKTLLDMVYPVRIDLSFCKYD